MMKSNGYHTKRMLIHFFCIAAFCCFTGCFHSRNAARNLAEQARDKKDWLQAITFLEKALLDDPGNLEIEGKLLRARQSASSELAAKGRNLAEKGKLQDARDMFLTALKYDPANSIAQDGLRKMNRQREIEQTSNVPQSVSGKKQLVSFSFEQTKLQDVFQSLAAVSERNILFSSDFPAGKTVSVQLDNISVDAAISYLVKTYDLLRIPLDSNTCLIAADTPENERRFREETVQVFELQYAECEQVKKILDPILKSSVVLAEKRMNAVIVRTDTEQMKLASALIHKMDMREAEVLVELQVLEINRGKFRDLGMNLGQDPLVRLKLAGEIQSDSSSHGALSVKSLGQLNSGRFFLTLPSLYLDMLKQDSATKILAQPNLKILNRVPAHLHIGEKVPVKVTTSRYRNTSEETSVYEYKDIGILMEITPKIISPLELELELKLEVSSIIKENEAGQPTIGTREILTTLRLRHGETEMIAGLIKDEERAGKTHIPLLGEIPLIGRLFSTHTDKESQTDIIVALTPYLMDSCPQNMQTQEIWHGSNPDKIVPRRIPFHDTADPSKSRPGALPANADDTGDVNDNTDQGSADKNPDESADNPVIVRLDPENMQILPGETGKLTVRISQAKNVAGVPFYLTFDPKIVEIGKVEEGPFLSRDGASTAFMSSVDVGRGRLIVGLTRLGSPVGISGSGELLYIEIQGRKQGTSLLRFDHQSVKDPGAKSIPASFIGGQVVVP